MESVVHRMCAEVVVDRNCQRVFPPMKKHPTQKEVRLCVSNRQLGSKPGFYPAKVEIGDIGDVEQRALFSFDIGGLASIDRKWITSGTLVLVFKKTTNTAPAGRLSWTMGSNDFTQTEVTNVVLKGGDTSNLHTLLTLINNIKTGSFKPEPRKKDGSMDEEKLPNKEARGQTGQVPNKQMSLLHSDKEAKLEELKKLSGGVALLKKDVMPSRELAKKPLPDRHQSMKPLGTDHSAKALPSDNAAMGLLSQKGPRRFESLLTRMFFPKVLQYLNKDDVKKLFMVNKRTYSFLCSLNKRLDFRKYDEVPEKFFVALLKKNPNIEVLVTGKMTNIKPSCLPFEEIKLTSLKSLDCSLLVNFDSIVAFVSKVAPNLRELTLPFFKLTSHSLESFASSYRSLESFRAVHAGRGLGTTGQVNMRLGSLPIAAILADQPCLKEFEVYSADPEIVGCLKKIDSSGHQAQKLTTFKLHHILLQSKEHLASLVPLSKLESLRVLHLGDLHLYDPTSSTGNIVKPPCSPSDQSAAMLGSVLPGLTKLTNLSLGDFFEDLHVEYLAPLAPKLASLTIRSPHLTDEGLVAALRLLPNLKYLKVVDCDQVQGYAFEDYVNPSLARISVSFAEYAFGQLQKLVKLKYASHCQVINYVQDK